MRAPPIKKRRNNGARDSRGRFAPGAAPGPGRPLGAPNRTTPLRETFASVFGKAGGESMLLRVARRYPRDFLGLLVRLEPRLLQADIDLEVSKREPGVQVIVPFNFRCDPKLLGETAVYESKESEAVLRIIEQAEHQLQRSAETGATAVELDARKKWFGELMTSARAKLKKELQGVGPGEGADKG